MPTYNEWGPWSSEVRAPYLISPIVNDTNVPLDTIIVVDQMRPMGVEELRLSPEAPVARRVDEHIGLAGRCTSFYFSEPLKPATTYNVTVFFGDNPISWNFTTTAEPYHPRYEALPSELGIFVAVTISALVTSVVGLTVWKKKQR